MSNKNAIDNAKVYYVGAKRVKQSRYRPGVTQRVPGS
jgi:hypothetical protein